MKVSYDDYIKFKNNTRIGKKLSDNIYQRHIEYMDQFEKIDFEYQIKLTKLRSKYTSCEIILSKYIKNYKKDLNTLCTFLWTFGVMFFIPFLFVLIGMPRGYLNSFNLGIGSIGIIFLIMSVFNTIKYFKIK